MRGIVSVFSPFLTISLYRAGHYFIHPVFSLLCHAFSKLVFLPTSSTRFIILLFPSAGEPPSLVNSNPRYLKDVTVGSSASTLFTVVSVSFVGLGTYSVFVLLIFSPCLCLTCPYHHCGRGNNPCNRCGLYLVDSILPLLLFSFCMRPNIA